MEHTKQLSSNVITLPNNEKVIILHEDEAGAAYSVIHNHLKSSTWDLTIEEDWSMVVYLKNLQEKLRCYLDGNGK